MNLERKNKENEEELLLLLRQGNSDAFRTLVETHTHFFYQVAYRIVLSREDAEDIVQDAFMKLLDGTALWDAKKGASFRTWFYRVVFNQTVSHIRKKPHLEYTEREGEPSESPEQVYEKKMAEGAVHRALKKLNVSQRMAVELFYYSGMKQKEAAETMGISHKAYESYLTRARVILKEELVEYA